MEGQRFDFLRRYMFFRWSILITRCISYIKGSCLRKQHDKRSPDSNRRPLGRQSNAPNTKKLRINLLVSYLNVINNHGNHVHVGCMVWRNIQLNHLPMTDLAFSEYVTIRKSKGNFIALVTDVMRCVPIFPDVTHDLIDCFMVTR